MFAYDLFVHEILLATLPKNQGSGGPSELSRELFSAVGKDKMVIFEVYRAHRRKFSLTILGNAQAVHFDTSL